MLRLTNFMGWKDHGRSPDLYQIVLPQFFPRADQDQIMVHPTINQPLVPW